MIIIYILINQVFIYLLINLVIITTGFFLFINCVSIYLYIFAYLLDIDFHVHYSIDAFVSVFHFEKLH